MWVQTRRLNGSKFDNKDKKEFIRRLQQPKWVAVVMQIKLLWNLCRYWISIFRKIVCLLNMGVFECGFRNIQIWNYVWNFRALFKVTENIIWFQWILVWKFQQLTFIPLICYKTIWKWSFTLYLNTYKTYERLVLKPLKQKL